MRRPPAFALDRPVRLTTGRGVIVGYHCCPDGHECRFFCGEKPKRASVKANSRKDGRGRDLTRQFYVRVRHRKAYTVFQIENHGPRPGYVTALEAR